MAEIVIFITTLLYRIAIIVIACYMAVTYSYWWLLLLLFTQISVKYSKDKDVEGGA